METLDKNAMEEVAKSVKACSGPFYHNCMYNTFEPPECQPVKCLDLCRPLCAFCPPLHHCPPVCHWLRCDGHLYESLNESLKACAAGFYAGCEALDRIEKYCEFEPAIEAARFKEQAHLDRIAKLEAKVQELELKLKR